MNTLTKPDAVQCWPVDLEPPQMNITDIKVYRYRISEPGVVDVSVNVGYHPVFIAVFKYGRNRLQRAMNWLEDNYPGRKVLFDV